MNICKLCSSTAISTLPSGPYDGYLVDCPTCGHYAITTEASIASPLVAPELLPFLSAAARVNWDETSERLEITTANAEILAQRISGDSEMAEALETIQEAESVEDEATLEEVVSAVRYEVSSYGADYDVEGLVRRIDRGDILIPSFQRAFVWNEAEASRFVESLLLGLPVPGIFLAKEAETNKLLVIDGQQRLKSLLFFYKGVFNPREDAKRKTIFRLSKVQEAFLNATYSSLGDRDRRKLDESIIHATVIKQESPDGDDTSIYHVFERLNTGGRKLAAQEIRAAIFHGPLMDLLVQLNESLAWRAIFGGASKRLKDQEMILRFLAFHYDSQNYSKPMTGFLNRFASSNRDPGLQTLKDFSDVFLRMISVVQIAIGVRAFRIGRPINVAVFDAVAYGVAKRLSISEPQPSRLKAAYEALLSNDEFLKQVASGTSDENNVSTRLELSAQAFENA